MSTILVMLGSYRNSSRQIIQNIDRAHDNFSPHLTILVTDSEERADIPFNQHKIELKCAANECTRNKHSIISALYFEHIQSILRQIMTETDFCPENIVLMRNDMTLILRDKFRLPPNGVAVLPRPWWNKDPKALTNTNMYILTVTNFLSLQMDRDHITKLAPQCWDTEALFVHLFRPNTLIPLDSIDFYQLDGKTKFTWDEFGLYNASFPLASSFLAQVSSQRLDGKIGV